MKPTRSSRTERDRGQTLPDFAVGIAIFLLTISFVVVFVPQMSLPFDDQEQPVVAERIANDLGNHLLADGNTSSKLDESCTLSFFAREGGDGCQFDDASLSEQLGIDTGYSVNVTLRNASSDGSTSEILCDEAGSIDDCSGGSTLAIGPDVPPGDRSVSTARVGVFSENTDAVLEVRVW